MNQNKKIQNLVGGYDITDITGEKSTVRNTNVEISVKKQKVWF